MTTQKSETVLSIFPVFICCPAMEGKEVWKGKKGFAVKVFDSINFQFIFV